MGYGHIIKPVNPPMPGLSDFYYAPISEFTSLKKPVGPFTDIGDEQTISQTHTLDNGFYKAYLIKEKHEGKGSTVGTIGSKTLLNEFKIFIPGFDAKRLEIVKKLLNEELITLHRDSDCDNGYYIQQGTACRPVRVDAEYTTGTIEPNGEKGFILTCKYVGIPYIYSGTVTIASDTLS